MRAVLASTVLAIALAAPVGSGTPALAQQVDLLGSRVVADLTETDVIAVPSAQSYTAVQICVAQRAVRFHDLDIVFANGGVRDVTIRRVIAPGECTRWGEFGGPRHITQIVLRYDTLANIGVQAVVSAYGRR